MAELDLQDVLADRRTIEVPIEGLEQTLTVVYAPSAMTGEQEETFRNLSKESGLESASIIRFVLDLVTEWGLTEHGVPVPITEARLKKMPVIVLGDIIAAIVEDTMGKAEARAKAWEGPTSGGS